VEGSLVCSLQVAVPLLGKEPAATCAAADVSGPLFGSLPGPFQVPLNCSVHQVAVSEPDRTIITTVLPYFLSFQPPATHVSQLSSVPVSLCIRLHFLCVSLVLPRISLVYCGFLFLFVSLAWSRTHTSTYPLRLRIVIEPTQAIAARRSSVDHFPRSAIAISFDSSPSLPPTFLSRE
jgi:hypothetical protein